MAAPPSGSFAALFAELRVDAQLGLLRVARIVSAVDAGRVIDAETDRMTNASLGDYLIPSHADVAEVDVVFVGAPDTVRPLGIKGIGEIGVVGVSAAIANAVYHATGRRIRSLRITLDKLL